jgi:hypothetical protein
VKATDTVNFPFATRMNLFGNEVDQQRKLRLSMYGATCQVNEIRVTANGPRTVMRSALVSLSAPPTRSGRTINNMETNTVDDVLPRELDELTVP